VSFGWIEFVIFTMVFNANITRRVNEEFLWGRQKNLRVIVIKYYNPFIQRHPLLLFARFRLKKFFQ
jgi:hypothetical protein